MNYLRSFTSLPADHLLIRLQNLNETEIGWNVYETQEGPQPNMRGRVTYILDAFWKKSVATSTVYRILGLLKTRPNDFMMNHSKSDPTMDKFVIHTISDPTIMETCVILKIHRKQLEPEAIALLEEFRDSQPNRAHLELYKTDGEEYAGWVFGPSSRYVDGKQSTHKIGPLKGLVQTEQVEVRPEYS